MTTASAPGKVILFGEHAVVSGATAIGGAIDLRAEVRVLDHPGAVLIRSEDLMLRGFSLDLSTGRIVSHAAEHAVRYIAAVLRHFDSRDVMIEVSSSIPQASGLGSSAAIVAATVAAISGHQGLNMSEKEIASISHRIEKQVQSGMGSPTDTALATFGGFLQISSEVLPLDLPELELVVGFTGRPHDTRSEVKRVLSLRLSYPDLVDPIFRAIGSISERAIPLLKSGDAEELGRLMNINHGLLSAVGVSTRELDELVHAATGAGGAWGAKLTGAGGGGCMIALPGQEGSQILMAAIRQAGGIPFAVYVGSEGLRLIREDVVGGAK